jgi:hypothetical protein
MADYFVVDERHAAPAAPTIDRNVSHSIEQHHQSSISFSQSLEPIAAENNY